MSPAQTEKWTEINITEPREGSGAGEGWVTRERREVGGKVENGGEGKVTWNYTVRKIWIFVFGIESSQLHLCALTRGHS